MKNMFLSLYISDSYYEDTREMLLIRKLDVNNNIVSHYVLITDFSRLLFNQTKANRRLFYCRRCLQHFYKQKHLDELVISCKKIDVQKTIFPNNKNKLANW